MTRSPRPRAAAIVALVLLALLSSSCIEGSPAGPALPLVPKEAVLAVVVEKPAKLYASLEGFWKSAGVAALAGGELGELLQKSLPNEADIEKALDAARPWVLAFVPAAPGSKEMRSLVYLPYRGQYFEALAPLASGKFQVLAQSKGYVVYSDGEYPLVFPPTETLDLSVLARYPADSVKLWANPVALQRMGGKDFAGFQADVRRFVEEGAAPSPQEALKALEEGALALLKELGSADAALSFGAEGLTVRAAANVIPGASMEKFLSRAAQAPSALDWAGQVSADALYGYAWSIDPGVAAELSDLYLRVALPALSGSMGPESAQLKAFFEKSAALQAKWLGLQGPRGAASLDMDFDFAALTALGQSSGDDPKSLADGIKKAMTIRLDMFQELKDEAKYRALLSGIAKDPEVAALLKGFGESYGIGMEIRQADRKEGSFSYGEMGFSFKIVDEKKFAASEGEGGAEAARAALEAVSGLFNLRYATSKGRFVATLGSPAELKALVERSQAPRSLAADPAFAAFAKRLPAKVQVVGALSTRRLAAMIAKAVPADSGVVLDPSRFGSWYSYLAAEGKAGASRLEFGLMIPAGDFSSIFNLVNAVKRIGAGAGQDL